MMNLYQRFIRFIRNQKLEIKILASTFFINIFFLLFFVFPGISLINNRYDQILYQSLQSSSAMSLHELSTRLNSLTTMSNIVRADNTVQFVLDDLKTPGTRPGTHYYSELYTTLQKHYSEYKEKYILFAAIYSPRFVTYTSGLTNERVDENTLNKLVVLSEEASGSAVFVHSIENNVLFLVREIKKIENLSLTNLGTFIIKIDLEILFSEITKISKEYANSCWILYHEDHQIYSSPNLSTEQIDLVQNTIENYGIITLNQNQYFAIRGDAGIENWNYIHLLSYDTIASQRASSYQFFYFILLIGFIISILITLYFLRRITLHLNLLVEKMKHIDLQTPISTSQKNNSIYAERLDEVGTLHRQFDLMTKQLQKLIVDNYEKELLAKDAQLKSLEAQMNPHFLYNTLESVNWRAKAIGENEISQMIESLGQFLRITLSKDKDRISLKEEIAITNYYMTIQKLRFEERLQYSIQIPEKYQNTLLPKLTLQPLLENAVNYALEQMTELCEIKVTCVKKENTLEIFVKNSGSEFEPDFLEKLQSKEIKSNGLGIALLNILKRIQITFGSDYGLRFYNEYLEDLSCYAVVCMKIPYLPPN